MSDATRKTTPLGVFLIAGFYLFGAIVLVVSLLTNPAAVGRGIADAHGLPPAADAIVLPVIAGTALLIAFGLLTRARWGFALSLTYLTLFGCVSFWLMSQSMQQPYIGNATWSVMALVYLIWRRRYFLS
jgi:hypothetical protein